MRIAAPAESVWAVISSLDDEPKYWKGTRSIRNISKSGGTVTREVTTAFRGARCLQKVTVLHMDRIRTDYTGGPMRGTRTLALRPAPAGGGAAGGTVLEAVWDVGLAGTGAALPGPVAGRIRRGTDGALQAIKEESEGMQAAGARASGARGAVPPAC